MSNSTKAGEEETRWGLKVRGDVMDTMLMIWWTGMAEQAQDSLRVSECNKLKVRFSFFTWDPDEVSASVLWPGSVKTKKIQCEPNFTSVFDQIKPDIISKRRHNKKIKLL